MIALFLERIPISGSMVNAGAIFIGAFAGMLLHSRLSRRYTVILFQGFGLLTMYLGFSMAARGHNILVTMVSLVMGSLVGEFLGLDEKMNRLGEWAKKTIRSENEQFTEGFVAASLLFCIGSMAILAAIEQGTGGFPKLFLTKAIMDGVGAVALGASLGAGVLFSALPVLVYEAATTLLTVQIRQFMTAPVVDEISAVGGLLLMGIALSVLEIKRIKTVNMLPSLVIAGMLAFFL